VACGTNHVVPQRAGTYQGDFLNSQQLLDSALQNDHIGRFLHRSIIARLKVLTRFARPHQLASLGGLCVGCVLSGFTSAGQGFIDFDHQGGDLPQPGKVGIAQN